MLDVYRSIWPSEFGAHANMCLNPVLHRTPSRLKGEDGYGSELRVGMEPYDIRHPQLYKVVLPDYLIPTKLLERKDQGQRQK